MDTVQAVIEGYQARQLDLELLMMQEAFFAGYFSRAKKPKPLSYFIKHILSQHKRKSPSSSNPAPAPDVKRFEEMEKRLRGE